MHCSAQPLMYIYYVLGSSCLHHLSKIFQKILLLITLLLTVLDILPFEVKQFCWGLNNIAKKCTIFVNLRTITQEGNLEATQMTPSILSSLSICDIGFCISKEVKFIFMWFPLRLILVCKVTEFLDKGYQFGQSIILFWKDTLKILKVYIVFVPPEESKIKIFSGCWLTTFVQFHWLLF